MSTHKSIYPKTVQRMIAKGYVKGTSAAKLTRKINESKSVQKKGLSYSPYSIRTILGNISSGRCSWFANYVD